ncbi:transglycosylase domain-containing protein [bacterium]|nr:transglycosylase domain-containing protein [bacterium]
MPVKRVKLSIAVLGFLFVVLCLSMVGLKWLQEYSRLFPDEKFTVDYRDNVMSSPVIIADRNNNQLGSFGGSRVYYIQSISSNTSDLSVLTKILFAKEDRKIGSFNGIQNRGFFGLLEASYEVISWKGKLRAVFQTIRGSRQGASGLLEQIAGNLFNHDDHNPWFKSGGIFRQMEGKLVKTLNAIRLAPLYKNPEQIVEDYVNLTYTAGMYHGIKAFMRKRFDKDISEILVPIDLKNKFLQDQQIDTINILAYYVGQLTGPSNYDPFSANDPLERFRTIKRADFKKNLVLTQMYNLGLLNEIVYAKAKDRKLPFKSGDMAGLDFDPNVEFIRQELIRLGKGTYGFKIKTTLIKEIHDLANYQLLKYRTQLSIWATKHYYPANAPFLKSAAPERFGIYRVKVTNRIEQKLYLDMGLQAGVVPLLLPKNMSPEFNSVVKQGNYVSVGIDGFDDQGIPIISLMQDDPLIKGAFILKSLRNGEVIAFVGGNYLTASISPGSAFKPFLLEKAMELGWSLDDRLNNSCFLEYRLFSGPRYSPENYGGCDESKPGFERYPDIKTVLKKSINKPMIYLLSNLTAKLSESQLKDTVDQYFNEYEATNLSSSDYLFSIKDKYIQFFSATSEGEKQYIGRIPIADQKHRIIFESMKREKYLELNESRDFLAMAKTLDADYEDFMRWHSIIGDVKNQFQQLEKKQEQAGNRNSGSITSHPEEIASLNHFYYNENGLLSFDPLIQDKITFINWELVTDFLANQNIHSVKVGAFTVADHDRFNSWVEDYRGVEEQDFFKAMFIHHPDFLSFFNVELFKQHIASILDINKQTIVADYSLPLGTHRISLIDLSNLYSQMLTHSKKDPEKPNNRSLFILPDESVLPVQLPDRTNEEYTLKDQMPIYEALQAARNESGGTSSHLKSSSILAGKTGTDAKYKTYVAVISLNGHPFLSAVYFGVDHNKHKKLVASWTAGQTAAIYTDNLVRLINEKHLSFFPKDADYSIKFDPSFNYDQRDGSENKRSDQTDALPIKQEVDIIWSSDGSYRLIDNSTNPNEEEIIQSLEDELNYSDEDIDQILKTTETN